MDSVPHWRWCPVSAKHAGDTVTIVLEEATVARSQESVAVSPGAPLHGLQPLRVLHDARRVIVHFTDVQLFVVIGAFAFADRPGDVRDDGIVARHHDSEILRWVRQSTHLVELIPGALMHYSVQTGDDFYHVVTRAEPTVYEPNA